MRKSFLNVLFAAMSLAAFSAAAEKATPSFGDGNTIVCGAKSIRVTADGKIDIISQGRRIAQLLNYYAIKNTETGKSDWESHSPAISQITRDGNKIVWILNKETSGTKWNSAVQTLEIMPDGLLKLSAKLNAPPPQYKFNSRTQSFWVTLPMAQSEGAGVTFNGKNYTLTGKDTKITGDWMSKNFKYTFYNNDPDCSFSVSGAKPEIYAVGFLPLASTKLYRVTFEFNREKPLEGAVFIDLR